MDSTPTGRDEGETGNTSQLSDGAETNSDLELQGRVSESKKYANPNANQFYASIETDFQKEKSKDSSKKSTNEPIGNVPNPNAATEDEPTTGNPASKDLVPIEKPASDPENETKSEQTQPHDENSVNTDEKTVHFQDKQKATDENVDHQTTNLQQADESGTRPYTPASADESLNEETEKEHDTDALFSTQVDEEILAAAQQRQADQGRLFNTEEWGPSRPPSVSLHQVVNNRVNEHYNKGLKYIENQLYEKAITSFSKAINLRSNQPVFFVQRAECFLQLCDFQSAILNYKKACVLEPNNFKYYSRLAFIYFFQGQCLFDEKLYAEALESFSRASEMRPEITGYHTRSIACLAALERHGECLALVNKRLEAETGSADLFVLRARLHELFKNTTLCYYDVKDALALEPEHREALEMIQKLKIKAKEMKQQAIKLNLVHRYRDALQKITLAIETDPSQPDYHITRGALQRRVGDYNAAIDDYLLAMDKTDHDEESVTYTEAQRQLLLTYNDFAVECFTKGFYEEAIILLNKAIKGEKTEKGLYINRGDCFFRQEQLQFALADYQQALEIDARDDAIHSRIAVIHNEYGVQDYQDKNYQDAESRFTLAVQHSPKVAQYYISRCRVRQVMENISGARQDLLTAMHLDPLNGEITSMMARLFPGKSVKDVLRSDAAMGIRHAVENLTIQSSPVRLKPLDPEISRDSSVQFTAAQATKPNSIQSDAIPTTWKPGNTFPSLKACMIERDFNIKVLSGKKQINNQIKDRLQNRRALRYQGNSRVLPLSEPTPYTQVGGRAFQGQRLAVDAVNGTTPSQTSTGWKKFSLGVGLPNV